MFSKRLMTYMTVKMLTIFSKNKNEFVLFDFLFWVGLSVIFPAVTGNFSAVNMLHIFLYLSAVYYAGELLLCKISTVHNIPFLFKSGIYIISGGIICAFVFLFLPYNIILYALSIFLFIDLFLSKRVIFSFSFNDFLCLIPAFVILFQTYELVYATGERYSHSDGDYYYYTAIVESLKTNQSLTNAVYHTGLPINYSVAPFLAPAQLARFSGISSQFALWGVYSKMLPILCLGTIAYTVVKLYAILFAVTLNKISIAKYQLLTTLMFLLMGPLHFLNLVKLNFKNTLFLGEGYVLPTGSPGFALSMLFSTLILLLVLAKPTYSLVHKLTIIIFLCIIAASKFALFVPLAVMLGSLSLFWLIKKRPDLFITLLVALPFCFWIYHLTVSSKDSSTELAFTKNGYYKMFFSSLADKYGISGSPGTKLLRMLAISITMWIGLKLLIFLFSGISLFKKNYTAIALIAAAILGFIISLLPGFFIDYHAVDADRNFLFDYKFDMTQFVRGSIFLLTLISFIFVLYLLNLYPNNFIRWGSRLLIFLWMLIISFSFFMTDYKKAPPLDQSWYKEIKHDFFNAKPGLMAMIGSADYSGQTLASAGVHPWFCTGRQTDYEGFIFTLKGYERNLLFQKIFDSTVSLSTRKSLAGNIKMQGVDCIVASPSSLIKLQLAQRDSLISPIAGTKWFYRFN